MERITGAMQTPDGYWRVEVYRSGREHWYRVLHGTTVVHDRAAIGTVQRILGEQFAELEPVVVGESGDVA
jgi:bifunctional non-homologous end joining protein LigD